MLNRTVVDEIKRETQKLNYDLARDVVKHVDSYYHTQCQKSLQSANERAGRVNEENEVLRHEIEDLKRQLVKSEQYNALAAGLIAQLTQRGSQSAGNTGSVDGVGGGVHQHFYAPASPETPGEDGPSGETDSN
jgi:hypothetical protein